MNKPVSPVTPPAVTPRVRSSAQITVLFVVLILSIILLFANFAYLNTQSNYDKQYIGHAGELRVLSQRIAKSYAQLTLDVLPERSQEIMVAAQRIIKTSLAELGRAGFSADIAGLLQICSADAERLLGLAAAAPVAAPSVAWPTASKVPPAETPPASR